jgi:hypothetical protein
MEKSDTPHIPTLEELKKFFDEAPRRIYEREQKNKVPHQGCGGVRVDPCSHGHYHLPPIFKAVN